MLIESHLCVLFAVQKAANSVTISDGCGPPWALETETDRGRKLGVQLVRQVPHHTQTILQTLNMEDRRRRLSQFIN